MLNIYFQAAAGAAVLLIWLVILSVVRKKASFGRIAAAVLTAVALGTAVYGGIVTSGTGTKAAVLPTDNVRALNAELVYTYAQNGRPDTARELLKAQMKNGGTPEELLLMARLTALDGKYDEAALLYDKYLALVGRGFNAAADDECDAVKMLTGGAGWFTGNAVVDEQIRLLTDKKEAGELDPASEALLAAYTSSVPAGAKTLSPTERSQKISALDALIRENIGKAREENTDSLSREDRRAVNKMTEAVLEVEKQCDAAEGIGDTPYSEDALKDAVKELKKLMERDPAFLADPYLRNVLLRGNVLLGDSGTIAEMIDENATSEELSVAIDLYARGLVTADDFSQVASLSPSEARTLSDRVDQIRSDRSGDMTSVEKQQVREVSDLLSSTDHMVVGKIVSDLAYGENTALDSEKSKDYLESAKGYKAIGTDKKAEECIDRALENYSESGDVRFSEAMGELARTLSGEEGTSVVDIPYYAEIAAENAVRYDLDNMEPTARAIKQAEKASKEDPETPPPTYEDTFSTYFSDALSQKRAAISIGQINKDAFPKVGARVALSDSLKVSESDFKKNFTLSDCSHEIKNYTVTKLDRVSGNIILCCDMSGSMSGSDDDLRAAVRAFIDSMTESEKVGIVGFTSSVEFDSGLMTDKEQLRTYADRIYASGGTAVYSTLRYVLGQMTVEPNTQNIVIMMTDGQDGSPASENTLNTTFAALAAEKGCTVYTVGLGSSIDQYYLEKIAAVGNGEFLYVDNADSLAGFYDFIHAQLSNQYYIEFEAIDHLMNVRELALYQNGTVNSAHKQYRLSDDVEDPDAESTAKAQQLGKFQLFGLSSSYIYKGKQDIKLKVIGGGFDQKTEYTVKLRGELRATTVTSRYIDSETLEIVVPSTIAVGKYDLVVSAEGEKDKVLTEALTVAVPCTLTHITFGSYDFTAEQIVEEGSQTYRLIGNVALNGWLHFKGDVTLYGNLKDNRDDAYLTVSDTKGAYVSYSPDGTTGLTKKLFAEKGKSLNLPPLQNFRIYGAPYDQKSYSDFRVDTINLMFPINIHTLASVGGRIALYPDMVCSDVFYVTPEFTFLDDLIPNFKDTVYDVKATGTFAITNSDICVAASASVKYDSNADAGKKFQFLSVGLNLKEAEVELNSITQSYKIGAEIGFNDFKLKNKKDAAAKGLGFSVGWSEGKLDSASISADTKVKVSDAPVPIFLSKVSIGFSDAAKADYGSWYTYLTRTKIEGGFGLETLELGDVASGDILEFFEIDDLSIAELDDGKISVLLKDFHLNFSAKLKLLGKEIASCNVEIGKYDYRNTLLGIEDVQYGVGASVTLKALNIDYEHLEAKLTGTTELTIGYPYTGLKMSGTADFSISWFIFDFGIEKEGEIGIGFYKNSRDKLQFTFAYRGVRRNGNYKGFRLDISDNGAVKTKY